MPSTIESLQRDFRDKGLVVLAINLQEPEDRVAAWVTARGLRATVVLDADGAVTQAYRVTATPTFVLVDPGGRLVGRGVGSRAWTGEAGRALIEALLPARRP